MGTILRGAGTCGPKFVRTAFTVRVGVWDCGRLWRPDACCVKQGLPGGGRGPRSLLSYLPRGTPCAKGFDHEMMVQTAQQGPEMPHKTRMDGGANRWWQRKDWRGHNAAKPTKAPKKHTPTKWKHFNYLRINPVHKVPAPPQHSPTNVVGVRGWRDSHTFGDSSFKPGAHSSLHRHLEKTEEGQDSGQEGAIMGHPLLHSAGLTKRSIARDERTLEHEKKHAKKSMALIQELHEVGGLHEGFVNQLAQRVKPDPKPSSHDDTDTNQELVQKIDEQILQEAEKTEKAKKTTDVAAKSAAAVEEMSPEEEEEEDPLSQIP